MELGKSEVDVESVTEVITVADGIVAFESVELVREVTIVVVVWGFETFCVVVDANVATFEVVFEGAVDVVAVVVGVTTFEVVGGVSTVGVGIIDAVLWAATDWAVVGVASTKVIIDVLTVGIGNATVVDDDTTVEVVDEVAAVVGDDVAVWDATDSTEDGWGSDELFLTFSSVVVDDAVDVVVDTLDVVISDDDVLVVFNFIILEATVELLVLSLGENSSLSALLSVSEKTLFRSCWSWKWKKTKKLVFVVVARNLG